MDIRDRLSFIYAKRNELASTETQIADIAALIEATELGQQLKRQEALRVDITNEIAVAEEQLRAYAAEQKLADPDFAHEGITLKSEIEIEIDNEALAEWCRKNAVAALDNSILKPQITAARTWAKNQGISSLDKPEVAKRAAAIVPFATAVRRIKASIAKDLSFLLGEA